MMPLCLVFIRWKELGLLFLRLNHVHRFFFLTILLQKHLPKT